MTTTPVPTARGVAAAQTAFGLALLRALAAQKPPRDLLLSPTSAAQALGMLFPALTGERAERLGSLLGLPPWTAELAAALGGHTRALDALRHDGDPAGNDVPDSLQTSNRLWTDLRYGIGAGHRDAVRTAFAAQLDSADLAGDPVGATDQVNAAVAEDTHGLVARLFDEPLEDTTVLVLTNAVHLRARWASRFTTTSPATFTAAAGPVQVPMMAGASGSARSAGGWTSVELPYRDGTLAAVAVLPPEGADPVAADSDVFAALDGAAPERVDVRLPRLRLVETTDLLGPLTALGMPVELPELGADARVDRVVQKAVLDVDQDGTVAAAATGIAVVAASMSFPMPRRLVTFDRPFLLLLTDTATRSPLFLAVVRDPSG